MSSLLTWFADKFLDRQRQRTEVHLRVHRALLTMMNGRELDDPIDSYFLNVWNASPEQQVQVTHVYIETPNGQVGVLTKPLPATVAAQHEWETWLPVVGVSPTVDVFHEARARLSNGTVIESVPRTDVPEVGAVPDG